MFFCSCVFFVNKSINQFPFKKGKIVLQQMFQRCSKSCSMMDQFVWSMAFNAVFNYLYLGFVMLLFVCFDLHSVFFDEMGNGNQIAL